MHAVAFRTEANRLPEQLPPRGYWVRRWEPRLTSLRPPGELGARWWIWAAFHFGRVFSSKAYSVLLMMDSQGTVVHRTVVFPAHFRFPFMSREDVQVGDVWTSPRHRERGLASWAIREIVSDPHLTGRRIWYITEESNVASQKAVAKAGFSAVARAVRNDRCGFGVFGAWVLKEQPREGTVK